MTTSTPRYLSAFVFLLGFLGVCPARGDDSAITPEVADKFGTIIEIEAEFVEKPNDYYAQNLVKEPFYLKVLSVNGKMKKTPIEIEYSYFGKDRLATGVKHRFKAYETIDTLGTVPHWGDDPALDQVSYRILHKLMIKDAATSAPGK